MNIEKELKEIWDIYKSKCADSKKDIKSVLDRGFVYSTKVRSDILITGLNPSWNEARKDPEIFGFQFDNPEKMHRYFINLLKVVSAACSDYKMGYADLFYYRETKQSFIKRLLTDNPNGVIFLAEQLAITQQQIEDARPKLILVFNKGAHDFWGKNPKPDCGNSKCSNIWMGYNFNLVKQLEYGELHRITGLNPSEERICKTISSTKLKDTLVYFSRHIGQYASRVIKDGVSGDIKHIRNEYLKKS